MSQTLFFLAALGVGAIWAVQPVVNAGLARRIGPVAASTISFTVGALILAALLSASWAVVRPSGQFSLQSLRGIPAVYFLGGFIGAAVVLGMTVLVRVLGAGALLAAAITGQLVMGALVDHFGLFGSTRVGLTLTRLVGIALLIAGANLVLKK